jgi:mannitol-1-/sugar-/sorbitol-6-phosphatase
MRPFAGLLLDSDGTLVDSERVTEEAWGAWAASHGLDAEAVARSCHGVPGPQHVAEWAPHLDPVAEAAAVEAVETSTGDQVTAYPGAAELLTLLPPDRVAVVTSAPPPLLNARWGGAGLTLPPTVVTPRDVEVGKPDPAPFLVGAERLGVDPADCLVVEDAPAGIVAGAAAGCQVVAVATTHPADELGAADEVFDDLLALLDAIRRL